MKKPLLFTYAYHGHFGCFYTKNVSFFFMVKIILTYNTIQVQSISSHHMLKMVSLLPRYTAHNDLFFVFFLKKKIERKGRTNKQCLPSFLPSFLLARQTKVCSAVLLKRFKKVHFASSFFFSVLFACNKICY